MIKSPEHARAEDDVCDPAKLAELMAMALRERGVTILGFTATSSFPFVSVGPSRAGVYVEGVHVSGLSKALLGMPEAHAKLLAIMATPPDESSRDACETIIRGEP